MVEGINLESVTDWVAQQIDDLNPPLKFELIAGGHSNLTYKFQDKSGKSFVLRRPPLGHVLESAHDMAREFRIITAVSKSAVPVPETRGLCEDEGVNGSPFYVMDYVEGLVPHKAETVDDLSLIHI